MATLRLIQSHAHTNTQKPNKNNRCIDDIDMIHESGSLLMSVVSAWNIIIICANAYQPTDANNRNHVQKLIRIIYECFENNYYSSNLKEWFTQSCSLSLTRAHAHTLGPYTHSSAVLSLPEATVVGPCQLLWSNGYQTMYLCPLSLSLNISYIHM